MRLELEPDQVETIVHALRRELEALEDRITESAPQSVDELRAGLRRVDSIAEVLAVIAHELEA